MIENFKGKILYIGGFELPDKNAAAHRVLNIAKSLRDLNYNVVFFGVGESCSAESIMYVDDFSYYNIFTSQKGEHFRKMIQIGHIKKYIRTNSDVKLIIAYNYPSFALTRIRNFCKRRNIRVIADCTEWYDVAGIGLSRILKKIDTAWRMKHIHKNLDGVICISSYLYSYYKKCVLSVKIPPTVDLQSKKYLKLTKSKPQIEDTVNIVYSGSPSASKESLGYVVNTINKLNLKRVRLYVVGITREQFVKMYDIEPNIVNIIFLGRVEHEKALEIIFNSNYSLIIRPDSRLTRAGFPTKFVEAISCGIPVIATNTSDLSEYLSYGKNGYMISVEEFGSILSEIDERLDFPQVERDLFDFRHYTEKLGVFLENLGI